MGQITKKWKSKGRALRIIAEFIILMATLIVALISLNYAKSAHAKADDYFDQSGSQISVSPAIEMYYPYHPASAPEECSVRGAVLVLITNVGRTETTIYGVHAIDAYEGLMSSGNAGLPSYPTPLNPGATTVAVFPFDSEVAATCDISDENIGVLFPPFTSVGVVVGGTPNSEDGASSSTIQVVERSTNIKDHEHFPDHVTGDLMCSLREEIASSLASMRALPELPVNDQGESMQELFSPAGCTRP